MKSLCVIWNFIYLVLLFQCYLVLLFQVMLEFEISYPAVVSWKSVQQYICFSKSGF